METNYALSVMLKNPDKTRDTIDSILKEIKEESIKIYDEVFKDFKGDYRKEYKELRAIAEKRIEEVSDKIRSKHFAFLEKSSTENES